MQEYQKKHLRNIPKKHFHSNCKASLPARSISKENKNTLYELSRFEHLVLWDDRVDHIGRFFIVRFFIRIPSFCRADWRLHRSHLTVKHYWHCLREQEGKIEHTARHCVHLWRARNDYNLLIHTRSDDHPNNSLFVDHQPAPWLHSTRLHADVLRFYPRKCAHFRTSNVYDAGSDQWSDWCECDLFLGRGGKFRLVFVRNCSVGFLSDRWYARFLLLSQFDEKAHFWV